MIEAALSDLAGTNIYQSNAIEKMVGCPLF